MLPAIVNYVKLVLVVTLRIAQFFSSLVVADCDLQGHLRAAEVNDEKGPSFVFAQLPTLLVRLPCPGLVTLARTSLRPTTFPNPNTSGRSRSKGSDCRTVRLGRIPDVHLLVPGRLDPGSYSEKSDSWEAPVDVASNLGYAIEERRFCIGKAFCCATDFLVTGAVGPASN
jgi:hypothetical protein